MPRPRITGRTTLQEIDFMARHYSSPEAPMPSRVATHLSATAVLLGHISASAERGFSAEGDRAHTERRIGLALARLSLAAQAAGSTLARCLDANSNAGLPTTPASSHAPTAA